MKAKLSVLGAASLWMLAACSSVSDNNQYSEPVRIAAPETQAIILLQHKTTGNLACCRDTADVTAEECARAMEEECYVRIQDLPYRPAKYDFLTTDTYPTRRWRENEEAPRW